MASDKDNRQAKASTSNGKYLEVEALAGLYPLINMDGVLTHHPGYIGAMY